VTSPLLALPGAIPNPDDSPDVGVAWHHGDPFGEQRVAARRCVVVDRSNRGVFSVTGPDRLSWLNLLLSQKVSELPPDTGTEGLVLDAHGRVQHHAILAHTGDTVWLDTEPGHADDLRGYLESMKFWSDVQTNESDHGLLTVLGPTAREILPDAAAEPYGVVALPDGGFVRTMPWPGKESFDLVVPREQLLDWWRKLTDAGARAAGSWTFEALRVESLRARLGVDTDERAIAHEGNWVPTAVHLFKGCYRGQETVSKVHNVGRPPRRMVLLHLDGSPEIRPETGDAVRLGERVVGRVGTVVQHHELGPIALALLKRSAPVDAELLAGDEDRVVQAAVDPDSVPPETVAPGREAAKGLRGA
jgi:hypothetical protein